MQAQASDSKLIFYWVSSTRDYAGAGYPGTGTPEEVAVAAFQPADVSGVVDSFNGRTGAVFPESGDYSAAEVSFDDSTNDLTSTDVQGAIEELAAPSGVETIPDGYSITTADAGAFLVYDSASDGNYSFPASLLPGQSLEIQQKGAGSIAPVGLPGQTFNSPRFTGQFPRTSGPGAVVKIRCTATDEYSFTGDLREEKPLVATFFEEGQQRSTGEYLTFTATGGMQLKGGFTLQSNDRFTVPVDGFYRVSFSIYMRNTNSGTGDPNLTAILFRNITSGTEVFRATASRWSSDITDYSQATQVGVQFFTAGTQIGFEDPDADDLTFINDSDRMPVSVEWISD